jgi:Domain of unknown function (DUF4136)
MKLRRMITNAIAGMVLLLLAGSAFAQDVKFDYDHAFDFATLKSFSIKIGTSWNNPISEQRVMDVFSEALVKKGWTKAADEASADAAVIIHGATQQNQSLNTFYTGGYSGWGWRGWGGMSTAHTTVTTYKMGTLVTDIFDAKTEKLVFRGTATDEVSDKPEKNTKKIQKAADKMFKNFPPTPKK